MSNVELAPSDSKEINKILSSAQFRCMEKIRTSKFAMGDILVRKTVSNIDDDYPGVTINETTTTELMDGSILPQRYKVIFIDETTNTAFLRQINLDGTLDEEEMFFSTDVENLSSWSRFDYYEVDSQFTDSVIFGENFNIENILKEETDRRRRVVDMNMKTSTRLHNLRQVTDFVNSLKKGDTFYFHGATEKDFFNSEYTSFEFAKIRTYTLASRREVREWSLDDVSDKILNGRHVHCLRSHNNDLLRSTTLIGKVVYRNKPLSLSQNETI